MKNVLLVFGGMSYEHDISVVTASQIFQRTRLENVKLIPFYISRENKFFIYNAKQFDILDFSIENFSEKKKIFKEVCFVSNEKNIIFTKTKFGLKEYERAEIAIFACHGGNGENGVLQAVFENAGIFTTAGNFDSLAVCMNKILFKQVMYGLKIPTVSGFKMTLFDFENKIDNVQKKIKKLKYPLVLKPNNGGSSIGLFVANNFDEFQKFSLEAFEFDNELLIEKYIENTREFNVAVLGDSENCVVSEVDEPLKMHEVLSFSDKYFSNNSKSSKIDFSLKNSMAGSLRNFPAKIDKSFTLKLKNITETIFKRLSLRGVVRIDYLYDEKNDKLFVCEANAIPGSLSYYFFNNGEILLNDFVLKLIKIAENYKNNKFFVNKDYFTEILT